MIPLVVTPIQFKYLVSFLEIYVFPRAGSPTITIIVGELVNCGTDAKKNKDNTLLMHILYNKFSFFKINVHGAHHYYSKTY